MPAPAGPAATAEVKALVYPSLDADPGRHAVLEAYLAAWNGRQNAPDAVAPQRERLLGLYAAAYRAQAGAADAAGLDHHLRLLWDLSGLAHTTLIPPDEIKRACGWTQPAPPPPSTEPPAVPAELCSKTLLVPLDRLPPLALQMLSEVRLDSPEQELGLDVVKGAARGAYFTVCLSDWSPSCPMDVCGSSEPLTRILILTPVSKVDLMPKTEWSLAAVAVHEAAHVAWFHRPEISRDPRLLLPVPNEREAWRHTAQFLRGLLRATEPDLRQQVQANGPAMREMLQRSRDQVAQANRVLRLPASDESLLLTLPDGIAEGDLRTLPR